MRTNRRCQWVWLRGMETQGCHCKTKDACGPKSGDERGHSASGGLIVKNGWREEYRQGEEVELATELHK